mgnify:CR=1 FL=1
MPKFKKTYGFRVKKDEDFELGKGGFGEIYAGKLHGIRVAAKFIDVTQTYGNAVEFKFGANVDYYIGRLLDETHEASVFLDGKLKHPNILQVLEHYIQGSNLNKIELVIITPKCFADLSRWLSNPRRCKFDQIKKFMIEMTDALEHVAKIGMIHRDMKTDNILISNPRYPVALLADFGLSKLDISGITPGFCAPEQLRKNGPLIEKTDLYALGVTIAISLFKGESYKCGTEIGLALLFTPTDEIPAKTAKIIEQNEVVQLVREMVQFDPEKRPTFDHVRKKLQNFTPSVVIKLSCGSDVTELGQTMAKLSVVDRSIIIPDEVESKIVSAADRDQKDSGFCWAFSTTKLLAAETRIFIKNLEESGIIDENTAEKALRSAATLNEGNRLVNEIICLLRPTNPKMENISDEQLISQTALLRTQIKKLCTKTMLKSEGWKQLPSLVTIFEIIIAGSEISSIDEIELLTETFQHPLSESIVNVLNDLKNSSWFKWTGNPFKVRNFNLI